MEDFAPNLLDWSSFKSLDFEYNRVNIINGTHLIVEFYSVAQVILIL
jgi:hypothetical protein